jgi:MYXO-CTERM domain-containing protein
MACDGTGNCGAVPANGDPSCGPLRCASLNNACNTYTDVASNICTALGVCATVNTTNCTMVTRTNCDDGNSCTTDSCDPVKGCEHTALPSCSGGDGGTGPGGDGGLLDYKPTACSAAGDPRAGAERGIVVVGLLLLLGLGGLGLYSAKRRAR